MWQHKARVTQPRWLQYLIVPGISQPEKSLVRITATMMCWLWGPLASALTPEGTSWLAWLTQRDRVRRKIADGHVTLDNPLHGFHWPQGLLYSCTLCQTGVLETSNAEVCRHSVDQYKPELQQLPWSIKQKGILKISWGYEMLNNKI